MAFPILSCVVCMYGWTKHANCKLPSSSVISDSVFCSSFAAWLSSSACSVKNVHHGNIFPPSVTHFPFNANDSRRNYRTVFSAALFMFTSWLLLCLYISRNFRRIQILIQSLTVLHLKREKPPRVSLNQQKTHSVPLISGDEIFRTRLDSSLPSHRCDL